MVTAQQKKSILSTICRKFADVHYNELLKLAVQSDACLLGYNAFNSPKNESVGWQRDLGTATTKDDWKQVLNVPVSCLYLYLSHELCTS